MASPFGDALADLASVLEGLGVGWYLFGAQAALLHGASRLTSDIDVTVLPEERSTQTIADALRAGGFALRVSDPAFVARTRVLPIRHDRTGVAVDVVLGGPGLEEQFLARSIRMSFEGRLVSVARAEDLVVMKVLAGRAKDVEDVVAVLTARGADLDRDDVRATLTMLEAALDQSDLRPLFEEAVRRADRAGRRV